MFPRVCVHLQALSLAVMLTTTAFAQTAPPLPQPDQNTTAATGPTTAQGLAALRANQPQQALDIFTQVLRANPNDRAANLLAASSAIELYKGDLAVQYAQKALELDPQDWKVHTTLVVAYAQAGDKAKRDEERATLRKLHDDPNAPDAMHTSGFLLDLFPVMSQGKQYRVEVVEYFQPVGKFHIYYRFVIRNAAGQRVWQIDAESNDFDQASWARAHPQEAAAGSRQFQIVGDGASVHTDYRMFSGTADYEPIRAQVVAVIQAQTGPFPGEQ